MWQAVAGSPIGDELLEWPPDLFALTDVILERSEAYRFALSPPGGAEWPPARIPGWADAVVDAGRRWSAWVEDRDGRGPRSPGPGVGGRSARRLRLPLEHLTEAHDWRLCEALLTLHAIADEACAGLGVALDASDGEGFAVSRPRPRAAGQDGVAGPHPAHLVRVLPKVRTPPNGTSLRSLSRYACVHGPGVEARWHKVPGRRPGPQPHDKGVNYLLLPWPLRVRESDFRPVEGSVQSLAKEPYGFFEFAPAEGLDLDLVDRMLVAARDEVDSVNVVVLPESAVDDGEIDDLEALLESSRSDRAHHRGPPALASSRGSSPATGCTSPCRPASTGCTSARASTTDGHSTNEQIYQYHLGGALHPHIRWWEAMEVPRRSVQFVEVGEGATLVSLVCEDLAQIDDVADVLRSVGPTIVVTPLLDGPQLSSRWAARYASVLADDPGSAVLTLTSFGMAQRSRPRGRGASPVVALWKDPGRGIREIPLEAGAQGVLISASTDRATRRSSDGRRPVDERQRSVRHERLPGPGRGARAPGDRTPAGVAAPAACSNPTS